MFSFFPYFPYQHIGLNFPLIAIQLYMFHVVVIYIFLVISDMKYFYMSVIFMFPLATFLLPH